GKRSLSSLQKSTPLISGKPTSRSKTSGFQKPMEFRHSAALCATPTTFAMPDSSMRLFSPSVRILWSSTMATLIMAFIFCQFQFYMHFCSFFRRINIQFTLERVYPLPDVPQSHPFGNGVLIESFSIVLYRKGNTVGFLYQLHVDVICLGMFQRIVDQLMDTAVHHDLHFAGQPGFIPEIMEIRCWDGCAKISQ